VPDDFDSPSWLRWERRQIRRARAGDRAAFTALYQAFAGPLYTRILLPRLGDREAAEEALAETFRVALERLGQFEVQAASLWSWLATIARNKATDVFRARDRAGRALVSYQDMLSCLRAGPDEPGSPLEQEEEAAQLRRAVQVVLGALNPRYRRVLELRFFEEKSRQECAALLEVRLGTLDVLVLRALRAFRAKWQEQEET
jgi:RNA polymerase sigma-70 factor (ECF subfamily)